MINNSRIRDRIYVFSSHECGSRVFQSKMTPTRISQRPLFRVHYRKLVEDTSPNGIYSGNSETITFIPPLSVSEYLSYCCQQCGHQQEIKVRSYSKVHQCDCWGFLMTNIIYLTLYFDLKLKIGFIRHCRVMTFYQYVCNILTIFRVEFLFRKYFLTVVTCTGIYRAKNSLLKRAFGN